MRTQQKLWTALIASLCIVVGITKLELARYGISISPLRVGTTPVTIYRRSSSGAAPAIVIAHGFAGSRQLMEAYALTLARAGYIAVAFDFEGHGRNLTPMSGDVARIDGTTQRLMAEMGRVTDAALALPGVDGRVALLGHSMASDIIVRRAIMDPRVSAVVAISMFSEAVTATEPPNLLMISGAWEGFLRTAALRQLHLTDPSATEGTTVGDLAQHTLRRAVVAPSVEHVGVLYSATGLAEARAWLDIIFERKSIGPVAATGGAILLVLSGLVVLAWPLAQMLPKGSSVPSTPTVRWLTAGTVVPALLTPVSLIFVDTHLLPVLVADYLAVHMFVYGMTSLVILRMGGVRIGPIDWRSMIALTVYGIVVFGGTLDRYVASFMPSGARLPIIVAIALGAVPVMLADSLATEAGRAAWWRVVMTRGFFLASLGAAVAFDFQRLFFLLIIIPVIVVFFIIFGLMGGWVGRRTGSAVASGAALGIILAWALGVSFPMFAAS